MAELQVTSLGKSFREYPRPAFRLLEWLGIGTWHQEKWVLRDVSFVIGSGESVGIIGRNGAGKSTLLKIITGVMEPSSGSVRLGGRVSALLELGMGFHPEFTGRQNVFMQAYLQGLSHDQVAARIDEIAAFAELGGYFDKPARIYSSGMQVRLAFSVATAIRPDILIVDEALAVGDAYFQHKCYDRIRRYRAEGTTLLFVSHDPGAVKSLCDRAILVEGGGVLKDGPPADVLDFYNALIVPQAVRAGHDKLLMDAHGGIRSGSGQMRVTRVCWRVDGEATTVLVAGAGADLEVLVTAAMPMEDYTIGILIKDRLGNDVFGTNTYHLASEILPLPEGGSCLARFRFPALNLGPSHYSLTVAIHASSNHLAGNYDWWERALTFQVIPAADSHAIGVCHIPVLFDLEEISR